MSILPKKTHAEIFVSAKSAILMDQQSGRILFEKDAHTKRRIASITKIMTAILAVESGDLDKFVTVSSNAVKTEGSSIYLKPNEKIKLKDLVYGLMLRSGNDAAVAIAESVGGSLEGFVFLMNLKAAEIGMTNTNFANPHGLDDHENHYSTAYDMAILTKYAMENETFREIFGTKFYRAPNPGEKWDRIWKNKNKLLTSLYADSTGGKTGYTKLAKRTLVSTASKNGMDLIAVTLTASSTRDWQDHIDMFTYGFKDFDLVKVLQQGIYPKVHDDFYKNQIFVNRDFIYPLTDEEKNQIKLHVKLLTPDKHNWKNERNVPDIVGYVNILLNDEKIGELPLFFDNGNADKPTSSWFDSFFNLFLAILGVKHHG